jgi:hypothetical protein
MTTKTYAPGVHTGVNFDDYLAIDAVNASLLKQYDESPAHALAYMNKVDTEEKEHFTFGSFLHSFILEPDTVGELYGTNKPKVNRASKAGMEKLVDWLEIEVYGEVSLELRQEIRRGLAGPDASMGVLKTYADELTAKLTKKYITGEEYEAAKIMAANVNATRFGDLLKHEYDTELTVIAEVNGVLCKIRVDFYSHLGCLVDLKSTRKSCKKSAFEREYAMLKYDIQAGLYASVAKAAGLHADVFAFVPVMKDAPNLASFLAVEDLEMLEAYVSDLIGKFAKSKADNSWPGYYESSESLFLPAWRRDQIIKSIGEDYEQ